MGELITLLTARIAQLQAARWCRQRLLVLAVTRIYARVYLYHRWMQKLEDLEAA